MGALIKPAHLVLEIRNLPAHGRAGVAKTRSNMWKIMMARKVLVYVVVLGCDE